VQRLEKSKSSLLAISKQAFIQMCILASTGHPICGENNVNPWIDRFFSKFEHL
jgi:hypothetical protein